jgi:hypothetical protein
LGSSPFVEVVELITEIKRQAEGQVAPAAAPTPDAQMDTFMTAAAAIQL